MKNKIFLVKVDADVYQELTQRRLAKRLEGIDATYSLVISEALQ